MRVLAFILTAVTLVVGIGMAGTSMRPLMAMNGWRPVFDMLWSGYDLAAARQIVTTLGSDGAAFYTGVQHRWDTPFPILLALTIGIWALLAGDRLTRFGLRRAAWLQWAVVACAALGGALDLAENGSVAALLAQGPHNLDPALVLQASTFTSVKAAATTLALLGLAVLGILAALAPRWSRSAA